jgi:hypothetical protein
MLQLLWITHDLTVTNFTDIDGTLAVAGNTLILDGER